MTAHDGRVAGLDPMRSDLPRMSSATALAAAGVHGEPMPRAEQWAVRLRTMYADHTIDGERLLARPRGAVGYVREVTGEDLARWADAEIPQWQHRDMRPEDWAATVELLRDWARSQAAAAVAATPADARRAAELAAARARDERRAELERQQADAAAELDRLDAGEPLPPRDGPTAGWVAQAPPTTLTRKHPGGVTPPGCLRCCLPLIVAAGLPTSRGPDLSLDRGSDVTRCSPLRLTSVTPESHPVRAPARRAAPRPWPPPTRPHTCGC